MDPAATGGGSAGLGHGLGFAGNRAHGLEGVKGFWA